ncbi:MAG: hypothetical protein M1565_01925 [Actinobacteria bacterium]|nr:hypothetical protein [Actinomycetota bacterium]
MDDKKPKISKKAIIAIAIVVLLLAAGGAYAYFENTGEGRCFRQTRSGDRAASFGG